jgi:hypothetical protein
MSVASPKSSGSTVIVIGGLPLAAWADGDALSRTAAAPVSSKLRVNEAASFIKGV